MKEGDTLGVRLATARLKRDIRQAAVATALNVSVSAVSQWENDSTAPELEKIRKLAEMYRVPSGWIIDGKPPFPDFIEAVAIDDDTQALLSEALEVALKRRPLPLSVGQKHQLIADALEFLAGKKEADSAPPAKPPAAPAVPENTLKPQRKRAGK